MLYGRGGLYGKQVQGSIQRKVSRKAQSGFFSSRASLYFYALVGDKDRDDAMPR